MGENSNFFIKVKNIAEAAEVLEALGMSNKAVPILKKPKAEAELTVIVQEGLKPVVNYFTPAELQEDILPKFPEKLFADLVVPGRKYDSDKPKWHLLPFAPIIEIVKVLTFGSKKYEENNWQKIDNFNDRYFASAMRHLVAHREGEVLDPESNLSHLAHSACCIIFLLWKELKK